MSDYNDKPVLSKDFKLRMYKMLHRSFSDIASSLPLIMMKVRLKQTFQGALRLVEKDYSKMCSLLPNPAQHRVIERALLRRIEDANKSALDSTKGKKSSKRDWDGKEIRRITRRDMTMGLKDGEVRVWEDGDFRKLKTETPKGVYGQKLAYVEAMIKIRVQEVLKEKGRKESEIEEVSEQVAKGMATDIMQNLKKTWEAENGKTEPPESWISGKVENILGNLEIKAQVVDKEKAEDLRERLERWEKGDDDDNDNDTKPPEVNLN